MAEIKTFKIHFRINLMILLLGFTLAGNQTTGLIHSVNHCSRHQYKCSVNTTHLQFTKEIVSTEYTVLGDFKSLHCCAKGYRSIEWMKDGIAYPWPIEISSFILYPEAVNQTIYSRQVQFADVGEYVCILRNDTHKKIHHISLDVQGNLPDMPLATFRPKDQTVELDNPARLYCEAFVGKIGLPDARSHISWYQVFERNQEQEVESFQEQVSRENGQIVGSYLFIPKVQLHNYGRYLCRIQIGDTSHRLDMYASLEGNSIKAEEDETFLLALLAAVLAVVLVISVYSLIAWCYNSNVKKRNQCRAVLNSNDLASPKRV